MLQFNSDVLLNWRCLCYQLEALKMQQYWIGLNDIYLVYSEPTTRAYSAPTPRRSQADTKSFSSVWSCWKRQKGHSYHHLGLLCYLGIMSRLLQNVTNTYKVWAWANCAQTCYPAYDYELSGWNNVALIRRHIHTHTYRQLEQQSAVPVWCLLWNLDGLAQ